MNQNVIKKIVELLEKKIPLALARILKHSGSAPRKSGTNMIITQEKICFGTIGGGILEATVIKTSTKVLMENTARIIKMNLSSQSAESIGMTCGGEISILVEPILPSQNTTEFFAIFSKKLHQKFECNFIAVYDKISQLFIKRKYYHLICSKNNKTYPEYYSLDKNQFKKTKYLNYKYNSFNVLEENKKIIISSIIHIPEKAFIMGAGHIAQPTAEIASLVGFKVIVMDDRKTFANNARFPNADKIRIIDFHNLSQYIEKKAFIVIITRGHTYDEIVLRQVLPTEAKYIGMIGSKKKSETIFGKLRKEGICEHKIKKIKSPIGLDIGSNTPEEIALSIVAEMVLVRAGGPTRNIASKTL